MRRTLLTSLLLAALSLDLTAAHGFQNNPPVTEITLERTACRGTCPVYKVTFKPDGTVTYVGQQHIPRIGTFTGRIDERSFRRLVELVGSINYAQLANSYTIPITDHPHAITSVSWGAERKSIDNYADAGPTLLWAFEMVLDGVTATVTDWKQVSASSKSGLITVSSVGPLKLGMTVAQARRALAGHSLRRGSDGEGVALIEVLRGKQVVMRLFADEPDPARPINERARVRWIEVWDRSYATQAGVRPGMPLREVESKYGKLKQITRSEIESREYATFPKGPAGLHFRVEGSAGEAGRYRNGSSTATAYLPSAYVAAILIHR